MSGFIVSQILVGLAALFDALSFQFKQREVILICLFTSAVLIGIHFVVLGNLTAAALAMIAAVRFVVAAYRKGLGWTAFFLTVNTIAFIFTYQGPINCLPYAGSAIGTWGSFKPGDLTIRIAMLLACALWLVHNIIVQSPGAVLLEGVFFCSNLVGLYRFYGKSKIFPMLQRVYSV